ncbi:hypothetical protein H0H93_010098 [Arthromyces matolae]|nr:hypothetical protein H0H93_010098 [Arthromyces matolae]
MASVTYIRETLLPSIPPCTYILLSHILNLMHEISLRSTSNRMDAHNLSIVLSPNLVKGSNPLHDVSMCAVLPTSSRPAAPTGTSVPPSATLGSLMKLCIERYFEIFDEVPDRSEAVAVGPSFQSSEQASTYDDESIDDGMLVMPIGPGGGGSGSGGGGGARYAHSDVNRTRTRNGSVGHPVRSRSIISIDSGAGGNSKTVGKKGTITLGRGDTVRKSSGSAVEAIGITAEGFFTSPSKKAPPPPVPPRLRNKDIA